ncbi:PAS domain-containing protein [Chitinophaga sp. 212800010-3]|uniref:PAS domain-containing protein n=1 Tax=unclassified Chitinophaga TaxID=2619133 RepID=UPI002DE83046|nr:PAS domain-containing protein [Chitinophaga sp. 212800010-3]
MKTICLSLLFVVIAINSYVLLGTNTDSIVFWPEVGSLSTLCTVFVVLVFTARQSRYSRQFEHLFMEHPIPMWIYEKNTLRFLTVNNAALEKYGFSRKEFQALTLKDIRNEEDIPMLVENAAERCNGGAQYRGIWKHRKKDGTNFFVEIFSLPASYYGKNARFIMSKDVDTEVKAAKASHELGIRYELLAQATNDAVYDKDLATTTVTWNHGFSHLAPFNKDEDISWLNWWHKNIYPADLIQVTTSLKVTLKKQLTFWTEEYRFKGADGNYKFVVDRAYIIYENGLPNRMIGMVQDIDKHVKQARQLEEQNKALKEIAWINSHEIRRPVVSILSITGLFDKSNKDIHLNSQLMDWLHESTLQLDEIIHKIEHKVKTLQ